MDKYLDDMDYNHDNGKEDPVHIFGNFEKLLILYFFLNNAHRKKESKYFIDQLKSVLQYLHTCYYSHFI